MQKNKNKILIDSFVIGAALFAMFFGAGNMIFSPYLGLKSGTEWFSGFLGYYIADIGLAVVAILTQIKTGGYKGIFKPLGNVARTVIMLSIVMCIGPLISIPRTAATTYELSVMPLFENVNMPVFGIIFFALVLVMSINNSAVVDIIGKVLTPVLFIGLLFLIIKGLTDPLGVVEALPKTTSPVADGIAAGYQSMDVLAAVIFGVLILNSAAQKGHTQPKAKAKVAAGASVVAGIGLLVVYLGLTYLGATVSGIYDMHIYRTELLIALIQSLIPGQAGLIFFAVVAGFACLSTAVALTGSAAEYLSEQSKGKVGYKPIVITICIFSAVAASFGVETLVNVASPVLSVVYPPVLVTVLLSFFGDKINVWGYRFAAIAATVMGVFDALSTFGIRFSPVSALPLSSLGLGWVVPSIVFCVLGIAFGKIADTKLRKN
ncbi:MAG: branched-chain amino acid transport system II carrier protein [Clostridia bacterium]|nr:branched-chain amino acid transport system II carrier protein [Clostridia bacterium]